MKVEVRYSVFAIIDVPEVELLKAGEKPSFAEQAEAFELLVDACDSSIAQFMAGHDHELCGIYGPEDGYIYYEL